jgi:hypothetical protein
MLWRNNKNGRVNEADFHFIVFYSLMVVSARLQLPPATVSTGR